MRLMPIVLDLCGGTGAWSRPYAEAGYDVRIVTLPEMDVRDFVPPSDVHGILAAPPCTEFAVSGARWRSGKPDGLLEQARGIVDACLRIVALARPQWWALENPVGRLSQFIGPYSYTFQPWEYGDPWVKRTCIWGQHTQPCRVPVEGPYSDWVWRLPPSPERATLRSVTPPGYARAFFEANP